MYGKGQFNKTAFSTTAGDAASLYATIQNEYGTVIPVIKVKVIINEKYCGDCKFQKTFIRDPITHKAAVNRGELPQFLVEDCIPAIIDKRQWLVGFFVR